MILLLLLAALGSAQNLPKGVQHDHGIVTSTEHRTSFSCVGRVTGYYADVESGCQLYHLCDSDGRLFTHSCPNATLFQQRMMICDHWYMVDCSKSVKDYKANLLIGQRDKPFVGNDHNHHREPVNFFTAGSLQQPNWFPLVRDRPNQESEDIENSVPNPPQTVSSIHIGQRKSAAESTSPAQRQARYRNVYQQSTESSPSRFADIETFSTVESFHPLSTSQPKLPEAYANNPFLKSAVSKPTSQLHYTTPQVNSRVQIKLDVQPSRDQINLQVQPPRDHINLQVQPQSDQRTISLGVQPQRDQNFQFQPQRDQKTINVQVQPQNNQKTISLDVQPQRGQKLTNFQFQSQNDQKTTNVQVQPESDRKTTIPQVQLQRDQKTTNFQYQSPLDQKEAYSRSPVQLEDIANIRISYPPTFIQQSSPRQTKEFSFGANGSQNLPPHLRDHKSSDFYPPQFHHSERPVASTQKTQVPNSSDRYHIVANEEDLDNIVELHLLDPRRMFYIPESRNHEIERGNSTVLHISVPTTPPSNKKRSHGIMHFRNDVKFSEGHNPQCPKCHPAFLIPGRCHPCVIIR